MKSKITTLFLFIVMIFLVGLIGIIAFAVYFDLNSEDMLETVGIANPLGNIEDETVIENKKEEGIKNILSGIFTTETEETITYSAESSNGNYFYEQLSDTQKIIYNGLKENKENMLSGNYEIQFGNTFSDILEKENGSEILGFDYQTAIDAYTHDNPDLFYLDISKLYLNIETSKKTLSTKYNVYISPGEGKTYYNDYFTNEYQVRAAIEQIENVRDVILSNLTSSTYKNIKIIHDYLIENVEYDENYQSNCTYSIYGALIERRCVCEGYAKAMKYLANSAGIQCELVQGTATNSSGVTEQHAWNCINVDGRWYYIDVTWDDPIIVGNGIVSSSVKYRYFLKGTEKFDDDHIVDTQLSTGGKSFTYPLISRQDY